MKKIVYAVYHDCNREARSYELLECCQMLGEVHFVSFAAPKDIENVQTYLIDKSKALALFDFISTIKKVIRRVKPDIVVLHDHDCAPVIPFIKRRFPAAQIVYDSSELYIKEKGKKKKKKDGWLIVLKQKLTAFRHWYEKRYLKKADVVMAANIERANIMVSYFGLKETPIVFDNIHRIDTVYNAEECEKRYNDAFDPSKFNVLFAGGISDERKTFEYIESFATLDKSEYCLIIVGAASAVALQRYEKLLQKNGLDNVKYLGLIPRQDLQYVIQQSHASVVIFDTDSSNTKFCASGKCYESLFEGVPILASENPPLKRLCEQEKIGVSCDDYASAIVKLKSDYDDYCKNVKRYCAGLNFETRIVSLKDEIARRLGESNAER